MIVGPSKFSTGGGLVTWARYGGGGLALVVVSPETGEREYVASVNLYDPQPPTIPPGHLYLKGWSENTGVPDALVAAGVVTLTGDTWQAGHADAQLAALTPAALADLEASGI